MCAQSRDYGEHFVSRDELLEAIGCSQPLPMVAMKVGLWMMMVWDHAIILNQFHEVLKEEACWIVLLI